MSDYDTAIHKNPSSKDWAEFFMKTLKENNWEIADIDEALIHGWFANAMMAMYDHLNNGKIAEQAKRIAELENMLRHLVNQDCINDSSLDKEVIELLDKKLASGEVDI